MFSWEVKSINKKKKKSTYHQKNQRYNRYERLEQININYQHFKSTNSCLKYVKTVSEVISFLQLKED